MRVFACKDLDGGESVICSDGEPINPHDFHGTLGWYSISGNHECCTTLTPGTFRELKRLDVVSGEFEFVEEVKVPTLREAWDVYRRQHPSACFPSTNQSCVKSWQDLAAAIDHELSKPAHRYDEALIDELLEVGKGATVSLIWLLKDGESWTVPANRRAAEILQALKRAKGEG